MPDDQLESPAVVAHARLVVTGADGDRLHEEIITAGGFLRDGRFARFPRVGDAQTLLDAATDWMPSEAISAQLLADWPRHEEAMLNALRARKDDRLAGLERSLQERERREIEAITSVLDELCRSIDNLIRESEDEDRVRQLELFSLDEQDQYRQDDEALRRRRDEIPGEIERETEAIRRRYAQPETHIFPAALTFLVPASISGRVEVQS